jgi:hypothetical protein
MVVPEFPLDRIKVQVREENGRPQTVHLLVALSAPLWRSRAGKNWTVIETSGN